MRYFRYKAIAERPGGCASPDGYSDPLPIEGRITDPLPSSEGRYMLCVVAGVSPLPDSTWQQPKFADVMLLRVDGTVLQRPPRFTLTPTETGYMFTPPASVSTNILPKLDTAEMSTCQDTSDYRPGADVCPARKCAPPLPRGAGCSR